MTDTRHLERQVILLESRITNLELIINKLTNKG